MKFLFGRVFPLFAFFCSLMLASPSQAQSGNTYLYIAHAASGRNISAADNPEFPVDISIGGLCVVQDQSFGQILGPLAGPAGTYNFSVSVARTGHPCTNPPIFSVTATLNANTTYVGVLEVNASNALTSQLFQADLSPIASGSSRVMIVNATDQNLTAALQGSATTNLSVGAMSAQAAVVPSTTYQGSVYMQGTTTVVAGPQSANLMSRNLYVWVLGGSASNDSVQILGPEVIRDVF